MQNCAKKYIIKIRESSYFDQRNDDKTGGSQMLVLYKDSEDY